MKERTTQAVTKYLNHFGLSTEASLHSGCMWSFGLDQSLIDYVMPGREDKTCVGCLMQ